MHEPSSDISGMLNVCKLMISCSDCSEISTNELTCKHNLCDECVPTHPCVAANLLVPPRKFNTPSINFLKDLFDQLNKISAVTQTVKLEEQENIKNRKRRQSSGSPQKNSYGGSIAIKMEEDIDSYIRRYRSSDTTNGIQKSGEMPKLERQDKYKKRRNARNASDTLGCRVTRNGMGSSSYQGLTDSEDDESEYAAPLDGIVDDIVIKQEIKTERIDWYESSETPQNNSHDSVTDCDAYNSTEVLNYGPSTSRHHHAEQNELLPTPGPSSRSRTRSASTPSKKSPSINKRRRGKSRSPKKPTPTKTQRIDDGFLGFRDTDYCHSMMNKLLYDMTINKTSVASRTYRDYEVTIKHTTPMETGNETSLADEPLSEADSPLSSPASNRSNAQADPPPLPSIELPEISNEPCHSRSSWSQPQLQNGKCQSNGYLKLRKQTINNLPSNQEESASASTSPIKRKDDTLDRLDGQVFIKKTNSLEASSQRQISLATCKLSIAENLAVIKLAKATNSQLRSGFSHETTHLILSQQNKENSIGSQEYLLAIVHGAFIVNFDWVEECLQENTIMSPYGFIPKTEEGPCRCLETTNKPFNGIYIILGMSPKPSHVDYDLTYQVTKTLIYNGGACMIVDQEKFLPYVNKENINPRFYICSTDAKLTEHVKGVCDNLKAVPIKASWVIDSIKQYRPLPINDYLFSPKSNKVLQDLFKVPSFLLKD